jgi:hypothetical protein
MVTLDTLRLDKRDEILRLAKRHGACNVRVFGSVARGGASDASDLDLLVDCPHVALAALEVFLETS